MTVPRQHYNHGPPSAPLWCMNHNRAETRADPNAAHLETLIKKYQDTNRAHYRMSGYSITGKSGVNYVSFLVGNADCMYCRTGEE